MSRVFVVFCLVVTLVLTWQVTKLVANNAYTQAIATHNAKPLPVYRTNRPNSLDQFLHSLNAPKQATVEHPIYQIGVLVMFLEIAVGFAVLFAMSNRKPRTLRIHRGRTGT